MNDTAEIIWKLPSLVIEGQEFVPLPGRQAEIICLVESDDGERKIILRFDQVWQYQCTFHKACAPNLIKASYHKLVALDGSDRLKAIHGLAEDSRRARHYVIYFDGGPLYEVIASSVAVIG